MEYGGYVYILTNNYYTVLYTGVTSDLCSRVWQHRNHIGSLFTSKYRVFKLVYFESHFSIEEAIYREKQLKRWKREWKWKIIKEFNPELIDLWDKYCSDND